MIDGQSIAILQKQIRWTGRSLLHYVEESFPWARGKDAEIFHKVQELRRREQQAIAEISRYLVKQHSTPPHFGPYAMYFTTLNYLSLNRLLPLLVEHQTADVQNLENDLDKVVDAQGKELLRSLLEIKKENLATLTELAAPAKPANDQNTETQESSPEEAASA